MHSISWCGTNRWRKRQCGGRRAARMSWCDKLASTPGVGFLLSPHFFSADTLVESLSPILDQWVDGLDRPTFTVNQHASFNVSLTTKDGFTYGFDHNRVHVAFNHRIRAKPVSGGPPVMEMLSVPKPYTALLDEACERLIEATSLLLLISLSRTSAKST